LKREIQSIIFICWWSNYLKTLHTRALRKYNFVRFLRESWNWREAQDIRKR